MFGQFTDGRSKSFTNVELSMVRYLYNQLNVYDVERNSAARVFAK